jgi:hypothetical protein
LVEGRLPGFGDVLLIVDCKRWNKRLDITHVEQFVGLVKDVGADLGMLMAATGYSEGARRRAREEQAIRTEVLTLDELAQWRPRGTVHASYRIASQHQERASAALREGGLRVRPDPGLEASEEQVVLEAFAHPGLPTESGAHTVAELAERVLGGAGVSFEMAGSGVTAGGGTPAHRWLEVTVKGARAGLKVLADSEAAAEAELDAVARDIQVSREALSYEKPEGWPPQGLFGLPTGTIGRKPDF